MSMPNTGYDPTPPQAGVMFFIAWYRQENGHSPTQREIASFFGYSSRAAGYHLDGLRRRGLVIDAYGLHRSATPSPDGEAWLEKQVRKCFPNLDTATHERVIG